MTIAKVNSLFCVAGNHANSINDQYADSKSSVRSIAWFAKMVRDENLRADEMCDVLSKLEDFLDQKESEQAEIAAELQLAYAFHGMLEKKRDTTINSAEFKR